ncbi:phage head-tail connector protein [Lactobacillus rhamnosus]|uniref:Phage head-tail connector protein n=1 Tax=Lacticaseibacillus rhamnosus TaxID=47715 RepID=A0A7Y7UIY8_LACRH|nr:head-tail connector protein [Lacticaseibacillus rhamnosus]NVO88947.1 phage head-tail connector protein [Lacticaseibacillus rhamnosus]
MADNKIDLASLKQSLRLLDTGDADVDAQTDAQLNGYIDAAKNYIVDAIDCPEGFLLSDDNFSIYQVAVLALAAAYYQNPVALTSGAVTPVDLVLKALIGQLRGRWYAAGGVDDGSVS